MKRLIRLALLAGVLAALVAWAKELLADADPAANATSDARTGTSPPGNGSRASNGRSPTREELYEEAQRLEIEGRSKMNKQELERAVREASR